MIKRSKGAIKPVVYKLFRNGCSPPNPVGACMVSCEETYAAYYKYHD